MQKEKIFLEIYSLWGLGDVMWLPRDERKVTGMQDDVAKERERKKEEQSMMHNCLYFLNGGGKNYKLKKNYSVFLYSVLTSSFRAERLLAFTVFLFFKQLLCFRVYIKGQT